MTSANANAGERGAALITVLSMVSIMATLAIVAVDASRASTQRTLNAVGMEQSRWYLLGAEAYAGARIAELRSRSQEMSIDQSEWQGRVLEFPLDDGVMRLRLRDGGNCFNLNSIAVSAEDGQALANGQGMVQFARLLDHLQVRTDRGALSAAVADWIDADSMRLPGGAEDEGYLDSPYRPANTLLADISELRHIRGFDPALVNGLARVACVRPTTAPNRINPNTLTSAQAPLLASAIADLTVEGARQIIGDRPRGGWPDIDAFFNHPRLVQIGATEAMRSQFEMETSYYVLSVEVQRPHGRESSAALLHAGPSGVSVVRRLLGAGAAEHPL